MATLTPSQLGPVEKFLDQKFEQLMKKMDDRYGDLERKLSHQANTMEVLKNILKEFQSKISNLESKHEITEKENEAMVTKNDIMMKENQELKRRVKELELFTQDTAQEVNQTKLEISGVPSDVDFSTFTESLFEKAELKNIIKQEYTITTVYKNIRHGSPPEVKSLVISLKNKEVRNSVIAALRRDRPNLTVGNVTGQGLQTPIFISEFLTPQLKRVLYEAKRMKESNNYQYLWVKNGQILLRKTEASDVVRLSSVEELRDIEK